MCQINVLFELMSMLQATAFRLCRFILHLVLPEEVQQKMLGILDHLTG